MKLLLLFLGLSFALFMGGGLAHQDGDLYRVSFKFWVAVMIALGIVPYC